jgi:anti-sigma-K factor RskA
MKMTPELRSRLASEYVLGTLRGGARRRFEDLLRADHALRTSVAEWEQHLTPLAESLPAIAPPARVWAKIEQRIGSRSMPNTAPQAVENTSAVEKLARKLAFWQRFGFAAGALASVMLLTLFAATLLRPAANIDTMPMMTAVLEEEGEARMMVKQMKPGYMTVHMIKPWKPMPNVSKELWVVSKDGTAKSLGVIDDFKDTSISMADLDRYLEQGAVIAISKEPLGGSPTGQPTGMVFCKGVIARMPQKTSPTERAPI